MMDVGQWGFSIWEKGSVKCSLEQKIDQQLCSAQTPKLGAFANNPILAISLTNCRDACDMAWPESRHVSVDPPVFHMAVKNPPFFVFYGWFMDDLWMIFPATNLQISFPFFPGMLQTAFGCLYWSPAVTIAFTKSCSNDLDDWVPPWLRNP